MKNLMARILLCAAALWSSNAALAGPEKVDDFSITEAAKRMMPLDQWKAKGQVLTVAEHEPVMVGGIAFRAVAMLEVPLTTSLGGGGFTFDTEVPLFMVQEYAGADSPSWGPAAYVFCQMREINPRETATGLDERTKKSRFEKVGTLCLVDQNRDQTFDRAVMIGVKDRALRSSVAIDPIQYTYKSNIPFSKSYVAVLFHHQNALHTPRFYVKIVIYGKAVYLSGLSMAEEPDSANKPTPIALYSSPGDLPKELAFGPSRFTVLSIDSTAKTAQVRIDADFGDIPVTITGSQ